MTAEDCSDSNDCRAIALCSTNPNCVQRTTVAFQSTVASAQIRVNYVSSVQPLSHSLNPKLKIINYKK